MQSNNKTVIGSYDSRDEALDVVHNLKSAGYQKQDIIIYGDQSVANSIGDHEGVNVTADTGNDYDSPDKRDTGNEGSLWDQIKGAFSTDTYDDQNAQGADYDQDNDVLYPYRDDIKNGKIVVAVDNFRGEDIDQYNSAQIVDTEMPAYDTAPTEDTMNKTEDKEFNDKENIQLKEEKLDVDKSEVNTGEVNVRKEVFTDTETVEVPVEKEEVIVERKPVSEDDPKASTDSINTESETINIPVKEEQIEVTKRPVVKEEVEIRKEHHQETKQVSEDVTREELSVDSKGDVRVDDNDESKDNTRLSDDSNLAEDLRDDTTDPVIPPRDADDEDLGI